MPLAEKLVFHTSAWNRRAILSATEMRRAEELACTKDIPSFELMRRAGETVAAMVRAKWKPCRVLVLCGPGNNGGDGFIAAEHLRRAGWAVSVAALAAEQMSGDAKLATNEWQGETVPLEKASFDEIDGVVDALFGTGLKRPIDGVAKATLEQLAARKIPIIAVDVPSGIDADSGAVLGFATPAAVTVTFFRKKPGHVLLPGAALCGEIIVAAIGIKDAVLEQVVPATTGNDDGLWLDLFPFPKSGGNKYTRGHALIYGGPVMTGAARLGARAAQRLGAGLVTIGTPAISLPIYANALESVIVREADSVNAWKELLADPKRNVLLIGPGLGIGENESDLVLATLAARKPTVVDADALSNFSDHPDKLFMQLNTRCVLTPHEGEFKRLFGKQIDTELDKLTRARKAAEIAGCIVLIKGADTVIADPDGRAVVNNNAPPWLATAGAGDVLSGMIVGLLAQNVHPFAATAMAVWIHASAANVFGTGLIAEDLVEKIPSVLQALHAESEGV